MCVITQTSDSRCKTDDTFHSATHALRQVEGHDTSQHLMRILHEHSDYRLDQWLTLSKVPGIPAPQILPAPAEQQPGQRLLAPCYAAQRSLLHPALLPLMPLLCGPRPSASGSCHTWQPGNACVGQCQPACLLLPPVLSPSSVVEACSIFNASPDED